MAQWLINISIVSEPYYIPARDNWAGDTDSLVLLVVNRAIGATPLSIVNRGHGWVAAIINGILIVAVYSPPSSTLVDFEQMLLAVGAQIGQNSQLPALVAGDFNAKATAWGSPATNARGRAMMDWAATVGLVVLNRGRENTCVRSQGSSIVDITLATHNLVHRVHGWEVLVEEETLSDHRYIRFSVSPSTGANSVRSNQRRNIGPRWAISSMDREVLHEAALVKAWLPIPTAIEVDRETDWFRSALKQIFDASMARARAYSAKRQVFWWTAELSSLRQRTVSARRPYTRYRLRRLRRNRETEPDEIEISLHQVYLAAKSLFRVAIAEAKEQARKEFLALLDGDPWGRPYKMMRGKLRAAAPPLTESMDPGLLNQVVAALFPLRASHIISVPMEEIFAEIEEVSPEEFGAAVLRMKSKKTAPGLDGFHNKALAIALGPLELRLRNLFTVCLRQGKFPRRWKEGKLVLLQKEGRPADSPSAYRPIILLDDMAKLFERVIANRLKKHLAESGPDLSMHQFGFRSRRSTIGAILQVKSITEEAVSRGEIVLAVSLDIANAFNTLPWDSIRRALDYHQVPTYLKRILGDYLKDRGVVYLDRHRICRKEVTCGVPQGSVLGPLLWNIGYDPVLRRANLQGINVVCYADDTLVLARGKTYKDACILAIAGVAHIVSSIRSIGLDVALNKSEAIVFHGPRNAPPRDSGIVVGGIRIPVGSSMRYLGLQINGRWDWHAHFEQLTPRLLKTAAALGWLLPNLSGPKMSCRKLYTGVLRSMALYGAPVWANTLKRRDITLLTRVQRTMAIRVVRGYRTISGEAAAVLASIIPWDLDARALLSVYYWREDARLRGGNPAQRETEAKLGELRQEALEAWALRLANPSAGTRTIEAVRPILRQWVDRQHGVLTFRMTQILSGHGCFGRYLWHIARREPTAQCHHCDSCLEERAQHTLEECSAWATERQQLVAIVGGDLSLPAVLAKMVENEESWNAMQAFCEAVMSAKEAAEREREASATVDIRRRRPGRRRRAYGRLQLP